MSEYGTGSEAISRSVNEAAAATRAQINEAISSSEGQARKWYHQAKGKLQEWSGQGGEGVEYAKAYIVEHPVSSLLIGFGSGLLLSQLLFRR